MAQYPFFKTISVSLCILFLIVFGCFQNAFAESLSAVYGFASATTTTAAFENVVSVNVPAPAVATTTDVLLVATFTGKSVSNLTATRTGSWRFTDGTFNFGTINRYLDSSDAGIGSLVWIDNGISAATTYSLQHQASSDDVRTLANFVAMPLQTSVTNRTLANADTRTTTPVTETLDTFQPVTNTTITVTTNAPNNGSLGSFYVAASVECSRGGGAGGSTAIGEWELQYDDGGGWKNLGFPVQRSVTGASDVGIVNLAGILQNVDASSTDYQFRLSHRRVSGSDPISTDTVNIVAVFTGFNDGSNDHIFDTYETNTPVASTTSTPLVKAGGLNFQPSVNTDLFMHTPYYIDTTGNTEARHDLYISGGFLDTLDQGRQMAGNDIGSGAVVGLATGLTAGTIYDVQLRHGQAASGQTVTTQNGTINAWDLNSRSLSGVTCPVVPPQTPTRAPGPDNALFYDGTDNYVSVPDNNRLDLTNTLSLECWVKPDDVSATSGRETLIGKYGFGTPGVTLNLNNTYAEVTYVSTFGTTYTLTDGTSAPDFSFSTCNWYHVAATYDNNVGSPGTLTLYVNGIAAEIDATAGNPATNTGILTIGQSGNSGSRQWYNGVIDEVRIWQDYAFGTTALRDWMCKKVTSDHPNWGDLSAYYRFDENGLGSTVYDYGSYGLNGTATNFAFGTERICSSAPIGDESDHDYNTSGTHSVALSYPPEYGFSTIFTGDEMTVSSDGGTWSIGSSENGLQLYMVDAAPNNNVPPFAWGTGYTLDPKRYWGVFVAVGSVFSGFSPTYQVLYDWTLHQGITKDTWNSLKLAYRDGNCDKLWNGLGATLNTTTRTLTKNGEAGTEYILGGNINSQDPLALTLIYFNTEESESHNVITVKWATATEINTAGFHVWRSESQNGIYTQITDTLIPAEGGDIWGATYEYEDYDVSDGNDYYYKLQEIEFDGTQRFYGPVDRAVSIIGNKTYNSKSSGTCFISDLINEF